MVEVSDGQFQSFIDQALGTLPKQHIDRIKNVAILYEYDPTPEQRAQLALRNDQTLYGLYEGLPLSRRQGMTTIYPDRITIFKNPMCASASDVTALKAQIRHTLWHEIAHYYGLNHQDIAALE